MAAKLLILVSQILLIKIISCQCLTRYSPAVTPCAAESVAYGNSIAAPMESWAYNMAPTFAAENRGYPVPCGSFAPELATPFAGYGLSSYGLAAASNGGPLPVSSSSPFAPNGVSLLSENAIEGPLTVVGQLPFLGTVALEGALPTAGAGTVSYGCGNGNVAILNEGQRQGYSAAMGYGQEIARHPVCGC